MRALAVARTNRDRVYAGSTDGQVWMGEGPAWRWTRIDDGLPDRVIGAISVDLENPDDILVALGGTGVGHVWRCRNTRARPPVWENVSGSGASALPDVPAVGVAHHFLAPSPIFYAATDAGMFATKDAGATWFDITAPRGLPTAEVSDLVVTGRFLDVSLFGRGVWRLDVTGF